MIEIDTTTEFGKRVQERLAKDRIIWLVTVGADGTPQPNPVWFYWHEEGMLIYSLPNTPKQRNIERNPRVAVHLDGDEYGNNIIVMTGGAVIDSSAPAANEIPEYLAKYHDGIESIGLTDESFAASYSVPVRFTPEKLRGY